MAKFKVGDRVKILDGSKIKNYTGGYVRDEMGEHIGEIATIRRVVDIYSDGRVGYRLDGSIFTWDERSLKPASNTIVVYQKDDKTVVALDKTTGETAEARCSPTDKFDFDTGAKLAFDRLLGRKEHDAIKVDDIVSIINTGKMYTTNSSWVIDHINDKKLMCKYAYGDELGYRDGVRVVKDKTFKVILIADVKAFIQRQGILGDECYLIGLDGLKRVK